MSTNYSMGKIYPDLEGKMFYTDTDNFNDYYQPKDLKTDIEGYKKAQFQTTCLQDNLRKIANGVLGKEKITRETAPGPIGKFFASLPSYTFIDNSTNINIGNKKTVNNTTIINKSQKNDETEGDKEKKDDKTNFVAIGLIFGCIAVVAGFLAGRQAGALYDTERQQKTLKNLITKWEGNREKFYNETTLFCANLNLAVADAQRILYQEHRNQMIGTTLKIALAVAALIGVGGAIAGSILVIKAAAITSGVVIFFMVCRAGYEYSLQSTQKERAQDIIRYLDENAELKDNDKYNLPNQEAARANDYFDFIPPEFKPPKFNPDYDPNSKE